MPKKPYNPVLGEVFCCYWDVPGGKRTAPNEREKVRMRTCVVGCCVLFLTGDWLLLAGFDWLQVILEGGPPIDAGYDSLSFIAEQVSHHPPGGCGHMWVCGRAAL